MTHMGKDKSELDKIVRPEELALLFIDFASQIRERETLTFGNRELELTLPQDAAVELELKAKHKKDKCKFSLELEWRLPVAEIPSAESGGDAPAQSGDIPDTAPEENLENTPEKGL